MTKFYREIDYHYLILKVSTRKLQLHIIIILRKFGMIEIFIIDHNI